MGWSTRTFLPINVAGIVLLKTYQYAACITLQLRNLTAPRLLNHILFNILMQLCSGNLVILIAIRIPFHPLH